MRRKKKAMNNSEIQELAIAYLKAKHRELDKPKKFTISPLGHDAYYVIVDFGKYKMSVVVPRTKQ